MLSTSTSEIVISITCIPNVFLHQGTHPVQSFSDALVLSNSTVVGNKSTQYQEKLVLESFCYSSIKLSMFFEIGFNLETRVLDQTTWFTFKTSYSVQKTWRLILCFCSQKQISLLCMQTIPGLICFLWKLWNVKIHTIRCT